MAMSLSSKMSVENKLHLGLLICWYLKFILEYFYNKTKLRIMIGCSKFSAMISQALPDLNLNKTRIC